MRCVEEDATIRILGDDQPFVSRGGLKLARALEHWHVDVRDQVLHGHWRFHRGLHRLPAAERRIAGDRRRHRIWPDGRRLRSDPRVHLLEKTNARYLTPEQIWH